MPNNKGQQNQLQVQVKKNLAAELYLQRTGCPPGEMFKCMNREPGGNLTKLGYRGLPLECPENANHPGVKGT